MHKINPTRTNKAEHLAACTHEQARLSRRAENVAITTSTFCVTPALLWLLHTQIEEFPLEYKRDGETQFPGGSVYQKLSDLAGLRGAIQVTDAERKELISLLDSIVGPYGWDTITSAEKRSGRAALLRLRAIATVQQ